MINSKVLYYTSFSFLDISLDLINTMKSEVNLHVLIKIPWNSSLAKHDSGNYKRYNGYAFKLPEAYLKKERYDILMPYFKGCASVHFMVYTERSYSLIGLIKTWAQVRKFIRKIDPAIINLEEFSFRDLLIPFLFLRSRIFLTIHDAVPHTGEQNWKGVILDFLLKRLSYSKGYFFFSSYSKLQFEQAFKRDKFPKYVLKMSPYSYYDKYWNGEKLTGEHILFFGRLSQYKGIDVLVKAMDLVSRDFPSERLIIAGRSINGYKIDPKYSAERKQYDIQIINRYIPTPELVKLIEQAKFVVCPYLDASQSGVLMTAFALNTPVIASDVGAFSEYIKQNITGILVPPDRPDELAEAIKMTLENKFYETMRHNIELENKNLVWENNKHTILTAFSLQSQPILQHT